MIQYVIAGGNEDRRFACNSTTGRIYTVGDIRYNDKNVSITHTHTPTHTPRWAF